jgi:hypothetical protein
MRLPRVARAGAYAPAASRPRAAARAARPSAQLGRSRRAAPARLLAPSRSGLALMAGKHTTRGFCGPNAACAAANGCPLQLSNYQTCFCSGAAHNHVAFSTAQQDVQARPLGDAGRRTRAHQRLWAPSARATADADTAAVRLVLRPRCRRTWSRFAPMCAGRRLACRRTRALSGSRRVQPATAVPAASRLPWRTRAARPAAAPPRRPQRHRHTRAAAPSARNRVPCAPSRATQRAAVPARPPFRPLRPPRNAARVCARARGLGARGGIRRDEPERHPPPLQQADGGWR